MNPETAIDFGRWMFTIAVVTFFCSLVFKTKWWRSGAGINVFCLALTLVLTVLVINLSVYDVITNLASYWSFAGIYTALGIVLVWRAFSIWWLNKGFWAWTKEK